MDKLWIIETEEGFFVSCGETPLDGNIVSGPFKTYEEADGRKSTN